MWKRRRWLPNETKRGGRCVFAGAALGAGLLTRAERRRSHIPKGSWEYLALDLERHVIAGDNLRITLTQAHDEDGEPINDHAIVFVRY
jgi:hypothetical protein